MMLTLLAPVWARKSSISLSEQTAVGVRSPEGRELGVIDAVAVFLQRLGHANEVPELSGARESVDEDDRVRGGLALRRGPERMGRQRLLRTSVAGSSPSTGAPVQATSPSASSAQESENRFMIEVLVGDSGSYPDLLCALAGAGRP